MLPNTTTREILDALTQFDTELRSSAAWQHWEHNQNHKYAIRYNEKLYPVKQIISMVTGVPNKEFLGGPNANNYIRQYGFRIVPLRADETVLPKLRDVFPDWDGFSHPTFMDEEITYKQNTVAKAGELLGRETLGQLLQDEEFDEFIKRLLTIGRDNNLLYVSQPKSGDLRILHQEGLDHPAFCQTIFDLLHGEGDTADRLGRYLDFVNSHHLPNYWTFPTYFLFVVHPQTELFIKPMATQQFLKMFNQKEVYTSQPTVETYLAIREIAYQLRDDLHRYQPRDMVDIQSIIWVMERAIEKEQGRGPVRYWKIAPGEGAWQWEECRDNGFIAIGWEELGDVSAMTHEQFVARSNELAAIHDNWGAHGPNQVWEFAQISPGDRIIANRGIKEIVGVGTVTGPYIFVPDIRHGHRLSVEWDDVTPRRIYEPGWVRTLIPLDKDKFEQLCESPAIVWDNDLAEPFNQIFQDRDEAEWAFDFLRETLQLLGVNSPEDKRFAITLRNKALRLNFPHLAVLQFYGPSHSRAPLRIGIAFFENSVEFAGEFSKWDAFNVGDPKIAVYEFPIELARAMSLDLRHAYETTFRDIGRRLGHWKASNIRAFNQKQIAEAVFDPTKRADLLSNGLTGNEKGDEELVPADGYFTSDTLDLLTGLNNAPTKEFYQAHKDGFKVHLEEPFQQLMRDVAATLPPAVTEVMETEKKIFARILKNDYGQGGAWDYYWGAFYTKGGKRTEDAQLSMWIDHRFFECGFYIGAYGSESRQRFISNCQTHYHRLLPVLEKSLSQPGIYFSRQANLTITEDGEVVPNDPLTWQAWLQNPAQVDCDASFVIPWSQLMQYNRAELVETVRDIHTSLFPLVLLATLDDPLPAVLDYLGVDEPDEPDEVELNKSYPLTEMTAETGLELALLERWVEAIERKGQAVLYGPPGTGKTYAAKRLARHLIAEKDGFTEIVQFHPSYAYEDFVQGIRPQPQTDGSLNFRLVAGRFMDFCEKARRKQGRCVLIIDEINRANLSRVFGELMYLLEYRDEEVFLSGSSKPFSIPANVRLIGTMNTADRSIALVDHALRRRFAFLALHPNFEVLRQFHLNQQTGFPVDQLIVELERLNRQIEDHNYSVGISFFLRKNLDISLGDIWQMEIEPYLEEYFFDRPEAVKEFRWDKLRDKLGL